MPSVSDSPPPRVPRPWDPDAARTGSLVLVLGLLASIVIHSGIPLVGTLWRVKSVTQLPVTMEIEAMPLPPADEIVQEPDDVDAVDAPQTPPTPTPTTPRPEKPSPEPEPEPVEADATPPDEPEPSPPEPAPPPVAETPPPTNDAELAARIKEREAAREAWLAERRKRLAERSARRQAAREKAAESQRRRGGAPEAGSEQGTPELVHLCTATDQGPALQPRTERPISSWMTIVPTVFAHFETRPNLAEYLGRMKQVYVPKKRIGIVDFAAPAEVMQLTLEQPAGTRIAVGRLDVRCLIGLRYRPRLFPIELKRLPARIVGSKNESVAALINITIYKDASLDIAPFDEQQPPLPFRSGRLKNAAQIARNIEDHFQAVRLANAFAELFGMKSKPDAKAPQSKPSPSKAQR
jgi:outer membrane biosynthesis protein TonB